MEQRLSCLAQWMEDNKKNQLYHHTLHKGGTLAFTVLPPPPPPPPAFRELTLPLSKSFFSLCRSHAYCKYTAFLSRHKLMTAKKGCASFNTILQKVHIYLEYHSVCSLVRIGTLYYLSCKRVCPPPRSQLGEGHTHLRVRVGWSLSCSDF